MILYWITYLINVKYQTFLMLMKSWVNNAQFHRNLIRNKQGKYKKLILIFIYPYWTLETKMKWWKLKKMAQTKKEWTGEKKKTKKKGWAVQRY